MSGGVKDWCCFVCVYDTLAFECDEFMSGEVRAGS